MRIAIIGAGGVGGYFGGLLARSGEDVTFIARGEHLRAMRRAGLRVESVNGSFHLADVQATDDPGSVGEVDLVIVATKTYDLDAAAATMAPLVGSKTIILPLQNGVEASERLAETFGPGPVVGGTSHVISMIAEPGVIEQQSEMRRITLGELNGPVSERVARIAEMMSRADIQATATDRINKARWTKFLFIASFGGVGAATRASVGEVRACAEAYELLRAAMEEIAALATARGIRLDDGVVSANLALYDSLEPEATASMQRDIMAGRPSELEAHSGYIARQGAELAVPVPVHTFLYGVLLPQERRTHLD